jgi:hypothetical protein
MSKDGSGESSPASMLVHLVSVAVDEQFPALARHTDLPYRALHQRGPEHVGRTPALPILTRRCGAPESVAAR